MVKINGCPNNEWPTRLTAVWGVYYVDDFGGQHTCVESLFPLEWKGGQRWEGCAPSPDADPNSLCADAPLTGYAEIGGSGPLHMDFGFSVDNGEGCVGGDIYSTRAVCRDVTSVVRGRMLRFATT